MFTIEKQVLGSYKSGWLAVGFAEPTDSTRPHPSNDEEREAREREREEEEEATSHVDL